MLQYTMGPVSPVKYGPDLGRGGHRSPKLKIW